MLDIAADWTEEFDSMTIARGLAYARERRVKKVRWFPEAGRVSARVRGTDPTPYETNVYLENPTAPSDGPWELLGTNCTCPVGEFCKHAAALLHHVTLPGSRMSAGPAPKSRALKRPLAATSGPDLSPSVVAWLDRLARDTSSVSPAPHAPHPTQGLAYVLAPDPSQPDGALKVLCRKVRWLPDGTPGEDLAYDLDQVLSYKPPGFVTPKDRRVAASLVALVPAFRGVSARKGTPLLSDVAAEVFGLLVATGHFHWESVKSPALRLGSPRTGRLGWERQPTGHLRPSVTSEPLSSRPLAGTPPWYLDLETRDIGPLALEVPPSVGRLWLEAPPIPPADAERFAQAFATAAGAVPLPAPPPPPPKRVLALTPKPALHLASPHLHWWESPYGFSDAGVDGVPVLTARLRVRYGAVVLDPMDAQQPGTLEHFDGSETQVIPRDAALEARWIAALHARGLIPAADAFPEPPRGAFLGVWVLQDPEDAPLLKFLHETLPALAAEGWEIVREPGFELDIVPVSGWFVEHLPDSADATGNWFEFQLGVQVGEERIPLLPILLRALAEPHLACFDIEGLHERDADEPVFVPLPDGRRIAFPAGRLRGIVATLLELHSGGEPPASGRLRVHRLNAAELGGLADESAWEWTAPDALRDLARRMAGKEALAPVAVPAGLRATLRPYQTEGLRWLQFVGELGLGGVLADDMGLGKTVQTIAHLVLEKEAGRLDRPCLVVSPTSVLNNWADELARFAPDLRVVPLRGADRHERYEELRTADVVLTTYALLPRDAEVLGQLEFHAVILDEAQYIKNPRTQAAQTACGLRSRHRLCLTGTPLENHLGELWSQFNFLIPGFLADETRFRARFRNPIEKEGDTERRGVLARRIRPFLLRRRKSEVAIDLPPKTETIRRIDLGPAQRDLYETIRLAMERRVREEISRQGLDRSHIVILDALLKLRQVCCDPRLVRLESARKVAESAKLDALMDMVPTLLEDGRRILVFSQFTSMLDLIGQRLDKECIPWLLLTGETTDRRTPVKRFQSGEVPLFLISLKAGGTGLNLTAADTVILYDPWWNPAVESQATDRAHRIGQDKSVFVYRLVTQGTVEEKILALQDKKRGLVEALLEEGSARSLRLEASDLDALFAPIA